MLTHLQIRDFAIIDAAELELRPGLTVLTGETGAGKSIVVDALQLIAGGRAGADSVRHGAERAEVSATFSLTGAPRELRQLLVEQSVAAEDELTIRRVVSGDGRSRSYLNGQVVPVQLLREVGNHLVDIHGQHEFQSLTRTAAQRALLDDYGRLERLVGQVDIAYRSWMALLERTLELEAQARDREARLELLRYQVRELQALELEPGEAAALAEERRRLANRGRLAEAAQTALAQLYESDEASVHTGLARALGALRATGVHDPKLAVVAPFIEEASIQVREAARELQHYLESLEVDTARQEHVERRLAAIEELARKHRVGTADLLARSTELASDLGTLERVETDLATLRRDQAAALESYRALARQLSARRSTAAGALSKEITARMQVLGMTGGRLQIEVATLEPAEPTPHGLDAVEFRVTANPGQPMRALSKVASGGELARLSLAVQVSCAGQQVRCMVFDEVDAGIGGAVAEIVGRELAALGARAQALCVTHLPQVASQGHHHLRVAKLTDGRSTRTTISELTPEGRIEELARMLGGIEVTGKAREHALEMLRRARSAPDTDSAPPTPATRTGRRKP
ncbi:MAG: DNA repair protein RecN [Gammaproteobacteria bacterium]|nr:DNA repair protein RecN [Gammaproteobacteria bacterium]